MTPINHSGIVSATAKKSIDPVQLQLLEQSFRMWADAPTNQSRKASRKRILLIFLIIRYAGAKLHEVLELTPTRDIDFIKHIISFKKERVHGDTTREVQISKLLSDEISLLQTEIDPENTSPKLFKIDPAHVRRKFYDCAESAGIPRNASTPEAIRRSRAVELMQSNVPLPVVQKIMGHSSINLAASYVEFYAEEIKNVEKNHILKENRRKTSARNSFRGKITNIKKDDIQSIVEIISLDGQKIRSIVTRYSQISLGLTPGCLVTVEIKAPWVMLYKGIEEPACSAENRFKGSIRRIICGKINSEVVVQVSDSTEVCAVLTETSRATLDIRAGDIVWAVFNAASAIIHID